MNADLSIVELVANASLLVKGVLALLLLASIASWAVIFQKRQTLKSTLASTDRFERRFWSGGDLSSLYKEIGGGKKALVGMESIFEVGFEEFIRQRKLAGVSPERMLEATQRAMKVAHLREIDRLEHNLSLLATVGSTSPYVGLFGTVWGIMHAFRGLANVQQATLQMVAPGIAEALVATAMGLFAAIPAVVAYNRYADRVERLETRFDTFTEEFSAILQRSSTAKPAPKEASQA